MPVKLYPNRTEAILAAEAESKARGYDENTARKYSAVYQVRRCGSTVDGWEAWPIHHRAGNRIHRRPIRG